MKKNENHAILKFLKVKKMKKNENHAILKFLKVKKMKKMKIMQF